MSNPILSDIIGQYGEFFKATDKFFNKIAAYSERILEETEKIPDNLINWKVHDIANDNDISMKKHYSDRSFPNSFIELSLTEGSFLHLMERE